MQYFRISGVITNEDWADIFNDRTKMCQTNWQIMTRAAQFNDQLSDRVFFFVEKVTETLVEAGVLLKHKEEFESFIPKFFCAVGLQIKDLFTEEVTLQKITAMLHKTSGIYIDDDDEVLTDFNIDCLWERYSDNIFEEGIITCMNKEQLYDNIDLPLFSEDMKPELDRIFRNSEKDGFHGHPVHYILESDDQDIRKSMYRMLLAALYKNDRISCRRYSFIETADIRDRDWGKYEKLYKSSFGGCIIESFKGDYYGDSDIVSADVEVIESICKLVNKYRNQVLTIFVLPRECKRLRELLFEELGNLCFIEIKETLAFDQTAKAYLGSLAKEEGVRADHKLYKDIEKGRGYLVSDLRKMFDEWYSVKLKNTIYPQYKDFKQVGTQAVKEAPVGSAYEDLMNMVGLNEAKSVICQALNFYKAQKLFKDRGMKQDAPAMHMVFTGNPGTAKTTAARLFAQIMKDNELLSVGNIVEVGRADLVGKYVGWTAPTIKEKFKEAKGGVLFIDEAYSLVDDRDGSYGDEAINTIVQEMENHRDETVVIFAGYPDKMEEFLQKNPGLRSRIAFHVPFADYDTKALTEIAELIAKQKGLTLTAGAVERLTSVFEEARKESDFGNGRFVRNVLEKARMKQSGRLLTMDFEHITNQDIVTICEEDIEISEKKTEIKEKCFGFRLSA